MNQATRKKLEIILWIVFAISMASVVISAGILLTQRPAHEDISSMPVSSEPVDYTGPIINSHDHIQSLDEAPGFIEAMDRVGITKTVLMGSSWFTLTLNPSVGFTRYDWNNEELMQIAEQYPGRFEVWPTVNPEDTDKLEKFTELVNRGATGLKLYLGHGYIIPGAGKYMFHPMAMDDPRMMSLYKYCELNFVPICFHVNPGPTKPGFAEEFIAVLNMFPDLKINCPHFMLSSIRDSRLREFLDTYPNLYTDVSFGVDQFLIAGLHRISTNPAKFQALFTEYPDRFMFGTDLVITSSKLRDKDWASDRCQAYIDMLSKPMYTVPFLPGEILRGVALPESLLHRIFHENYEDFVAKKPVGTPITRQINWAATGVERTGRAAGVALPPE